jgi:hypothetical protein
MLLTTNNLSLNNKKGKNRETLCATAFDVV